MSDVPPARRLLRFRHVSPPESSSPAGGSSSGEPPTRPAAEADAVLRGVLRAWHVPPPSDAAAARLLESYRRETRQAPDTAVRGWRMPGDGARTLPAWAASSSGTRRRRAISAGAALAVAALAAATSWWGIAPLSAHAALDHADRARIARLAGVVAPVIHQRLALQASSTTSPRGASEELSDQASQRATATSSERSPGTSPPPPPTFPQGYTRLLTATCDVWSDIVTGRRRVRIATPTPEVERLLSRYSAMLSHNGLADDPPLSARGFAGWRARAGTVTDRVEHVTVSGASDRVRVVSRVASPVDAGAIVEATLVLRTEDWHPVQQIVLVQDAAGAIERFEVTEDLFDLMPRTAMPAGLFEGTDDGPAPAVDAAAASPAPAATPDLEAIEIGVLFALHELGADLGEQLTVVRRATVVEVRGVVETPARRAEIMSALVRLPHVQVALETGQDAADALRRAGEAAAATPHAPQEWSTPRGGGLLPIVEAYVRARLALETPASDARAPAPTPRDTAIAVNGFIHEMSGATEAAVAEAWALRRLAERYPAPARREMSSGSQRLLRIMTHDHLASTRTHLVRLRRGLEAIAATVGADPGTASDPPPAGTTSAAAERLESSELAAGQIFLAVVDVERRVAALLVTGSGVGGETPPNERAGTGAGDGPADLSALGSLRDLLGRLADLDRRLEAARDATTAGGRP